MKSYIRYTLIAAALFTVFITLLPHSRAERNGNKLATAVSSSFALCVNNPIVTTNTDSGAGSLRQAILDACPGSTINFDDGVISPVTLTSGELAINKDLTIQGPVSNPLTIMRSATGGTPDFRIFNITSGTVAISKLTVTNGKAPDGAAGGSVGTRGGDGGGIKNSSTLTLTDVVVSGNVTGRGGNGGQTSGNGGYGGGVYNTGALTMINCIVNGNRTGMDGHGGTTGSSGGWGGGIYSSGLSGSKTMNLINVVVSNNSAGNSDNVDGFGGQAGGIFIEATSTVTMVNCTVSGNSAGIGTGFLGYAGSSGGVISNGSLTIANSTISGNLSYTTGGGILARGGVLTITNSTISGNQGEAGSGIAVDTSATMTMTNSTVTKNTNFTNSGSGVSNYGSVSHSQVKNSIIAGNGGTGGADLSGKFTSQGFNLIGKSDGSNGFTNGVNGDKVGTNASPLNAMLAPLANYGGTTQTHLLLPSSPAIDAGSNALVPPDTFDLDGDSDTAEPVPFDQRGTGFPRLVNTTVDMGAVEVNYAISATAGSGQSAAMNTAFALQLKATVTESGILRSGIPVTFTAPSSGASGTFAGGVTTITVNTDSNGVATAPVLTANGTLGSYNVVASLGVSPSATFSLTNTKADQMINFGPLMTKTYGDPPFNLSATATSGLPVSFSIISGPATLSGNTVTLTGAGTVTIRASQAGDSNYNAAPSVDQSFTVAQAVTTTTVTSSVSPSEFGQSVSFTATITASVGTPTGTVQFKVDGNNLGSAVGCVASVGSSCTAQVSTSNLTTGTHVITADYSGDADFNSSAGTLTGNQVVKPQPTLAINDVPVTETDSGTTNAVFTVTLSAASSLTVTVDFVIASGTATAGTDYQAASGTLTFNPGDTQKTITVTINGDTSFEPDETFFVNLSNAQNATINDAQGLGTILNDDPQGGVIRLSQPNYTFNESNGSVSVQIKRTGDATAPVSVSYATSDGSAQQRTDYAVASGIVNFAAGETTKTIALLINDDNYVEGSEQFNITLSNATGGAVLGAQASASVAINDNDFTPPNSNLIDDAQNFVYQHYHDFLSREPDADGIGYWSSQITACGSDQTCINARRVDVSNAFFFELEYQQTGAYVYRLYRAAYGNNQPFPNPGPDSLPADPVKAAHLPSYAVFSADRARVVGGSSLSQSQLDLANQFVLRPEFLAKYPASLSTGAQFVDAILSNIGNDIGVDLSSQRNALIAQYNAGGRGMVLYRLADDNAQANPIGNRAFIDAEYNRAFVLTEYFGYLRRDPDMGGINFWLDVLKNFPVRDTRGQHAMVCSFITSREYQERFSSVSTHSNQECGQ